MTGHHCPTGWHKKPSNACYSRHACRCDGCRTDRRHYDRRRRAAKKAATLRARAEDDARPLPTPAPDGLFVPPGHKAVVVPERSWERIVKALARWGVTPDEWIDNVARQADRRVA